MSVMVFAVAAAIIANWGLVEVWRHGSIFASWRARLEVRQGKFLADLLLCPFCLSHWTGAVLTILSLFGFVGYEFVTLREWAGTVVLWLVVVRLSNLANDVCHKITKTPDRRLNLADLEKIANS